MDANVYETPNKCNGVGYGLLSCLCPCISLGSFVIGTYMIANRICFFCCPSSLPYETSLGDTYCKWGGIYYGYLFSKSMLEKSYYHLSSSVDVNTDMTRQ